MVDLVEDFNTDIRYKLLLRFPGERDGHTIDSSDDVSELDSRIEELKYENLPEGTMVYVVAVPKHRLGGHRTIMESRIYKVENRDLVRSKWVSARTY